MAGEPKACGALSRWERERVRGFRAGAWPAPHWEGSQRGGVHMKGHRLVLLSLLIALGAWTGLGWAQQPKPGGTLRIALSGDLTFLNANQGTAPGYETF